MGVCNHCRETKQGAVSAISAKKGHGPRLITGLTASIVMLLSLLMFRHSHTNSSIRTFSKQRQRDQQFMRSLLEAVRGYDCDRDDRNHLKDSNGVLYKLAPSRVKNTTTVLDFRGHGRPKRPTDSSTDSSTVSEFA